MIVPGTVDTPYPHGVLGCLLSALALLQINRFVSLHDSDYRCRPSIIRNGLPLGAGVLYIAPTQINLFKVVLKSLYRVGIRPCHFLPKSK